MVQRRLGIDEMEELVELQLRSWNDWPARFGCNRREIWPTPSYGLSRVEERHCVAGEFQLLDWAHHLVLTEKGNGGRVFICEHGVFVYLEEVRGMIQLAEFDLGSASNLKARCRAH